MPNLHLFRVVAAIMTVAAMAFAQQPNPNSKLTAEEILDRYVDAIGGCAAHDKIVTISVKGFENDWHGKRWEFEYYSNKQNHKYLSVMRREGEEIRDGFDGENFWTQRNHGKAKVVHGEAEYDMRNAMEFATLCTGAKVLRKLSSREPKMSLASRPT